MKRFNCEFSDPKTGETRVIAVELNADEIEKAGGCELYVQAYVLRHGYRAAPNGFCHIRGGIRAIAVH